MSCFSTRRLGTLGLLGALCCAGDHLASAQVSNPDRFNLSDEIRVDEVDQAAVAHLQNATALVAQGQYDEALGQLRQVAETDGTKVIQVRPDRYIGVRDYCHMRIAALPVEALQLYRRRVDPLAEQWYRTGLREPEGRLLKQLVEQMFCSTWGDDALLALGERALERGEPAIARAYWMKLFASPPEVVPGELFQNVRDSDQLAPSDAALLKKAYVQQVVAPAGDGNSEVWFVRRNLAVPLSDTETARLVQFWTGHGIIDQRLAYPDSPLLRADIRARILLADIMEDSFKRASEGLAQFRRLHPGARGRLAGQEVDYAQKLASLLEESRQWPSRRSSSGWPMFGGSTEREKRINLSGLIEPSLRGAIWRHALAPISPAVTQAGEKPLRQGRVGETVDRLLSYHPVIVGRHLFVATADSIYAWDVQTGRPAWPGGDDDGDDDDDDNNIDAARIYHDAAPQAEHQTIASRGVPRFTLSIHNDRLFARMGSTITARGRLHDDARRAPPSKSKIVILDISDQGQGRIVRESITPQQPGWSFEGPPISDGRNIYVAVRRSDVQPEAHVACYDLSSDPPRRLWRQFVSAADTPSGGNLAERTHNLLTLHGSTLYFNTNVGAIAALSTLDGHVEWIYRYRRAKLGHLAMLKDSPHFYRDLNPCIYHQGTLYVAPFDASTLLAIDAATGELQWSTDAAADATQLLGIADGQLIAAGDRLTSLDAESGRRLFQWPDGDRAEPPATGRGLIADGVVYWPTRERVFLFDLAASRAAGAARMPRQPIRLVPRGVTGGNLLVTDGRLLITTSREVIALETPQSPTGRK